MEYCFCLLFSPTSTTFAPTFWTSSKNEFGGSSPSRPRFLGVRLRRPCAVKGPRGFGPSSPPPPKKEENKRKRRRLEDEDEGFDDEIESSDDDTIPEVVTNRMLRRMGVSIGAPLGVGLLFFPLFYYLKVVAEVEVPPWLPFSVSFVFLGVALLGVSYGIVSASWDPLREGSLLGWNEARRNWPVFWQSLWSARNNNNNNSTRR